MTDTYCKICNKIMEIGTSMLGHIYEFHPSAFIDMLMDNPSIIKSTWKYFEER
jgi:hypothetical protein